MMSNELMQINNNFPSQVELQSVSLIARTAQQSGLYKGVGSEAVIMMILLAARELGVGPCQALNGGIWSIQGKIEISARMMNGLIRRAGHSIKIIKSTDTECTLLGTRTDGDSFECSFDMDDAVKAGLASGNVWKKYPADMLYNRCMSRLGRRLFSDVIGQCYIEGEIKEAKEVEKLEQADCEDVTKPNIEVEASAQKEPEVEDKFKTKISMEQCEILGGLHASCDKEFRKNFGDYMRDKWGAYAINDIPAICFEVAFKGMQANIDKNKEKAQICA